MLRGMKEREVATKGGEEIGKRQRTGGICTIL